MARIDAVFDEEVDYGFEGGARYQTNISENPNRFEEVDSDWKYGKHEFEASFGDISDERRDRVIAVFHICRGRRHWFKFKDWNDYDVADQPLQVGADGTTDVIQLYKLYDGAAHDFGTAYTVRPVQAWKWAEVRRVSDDSLVEGTLDLNTGLFTPDDPWEEEEYYVLNGEFYVWVRFDDDYNPMTINSWRANTAKVKLMEKPIAFTATNVPQQWEGDE